MLQRMNYNQGSPFIQVEGIKEGTKRQNHYDLQITLGRELFYGHLLRGQLGLVPCF